MSSAKPEKPQLSRVFNDPLDFLLAVMDDVTGDSALRIEAAKALMPYGYESLGEYEDDD